ncbi:YbjQ family protein [Geodermatophilus normandii]|uniref:UPF0145 protein GCU54_06435 n=1 Tax=Geodermatophilus normandii TaxID=1137989 RepID=A0A6P0GEH4_9ACTN|nr:YbjQ family protein [Geodermatophilus normandii]
MLITTNDVPGRRVEAVLGEVFGLTVRSRHAGAQLGAAMKSLTGGELRGLTENLEESRREALGRLTAAAEARGADAVLAMRFDTTEMGGTWSEVCAYGTACRPARSDRHHPGRSAPGRDGRQARRHPARRWTRGRPRRSGSRATRGSATPTR